MTEQTSSITVLLQCKEISLYRESSMIVLFQEPGKKATRYVAQQNLESPSCFFFVLTSFTQFFRLHHWHCPRITSFVSLRGIKAGNPVRERGTHLSSSGNRSEHFAKKSIISFSRGRFFEKKLISKLFIPFTQNITSTRNFLCRPIGKLTSVRKTIYK